MVVYDVPTLSHTRARLHVTICRHHGRGVKASECGLREALRLCTDGRWARNDFPWSADLAQANRDYFGNSAFRPNQREAINATLSRQDCFVLMPTGGGAAVVLHGSSTAL